MSNFYFCIIAYLCNAWLLVKKSSDGVPLESISRFPSMSVLSLKYDSREVPQYVLPLFVVLFLILHIEHLFLYGEYYYLKMNYNGYTYYIILCYVIICYNMYNKYYSTHIYIIFYTICVRCKHAFPFPTPPIWLILNTTSLLSP